MPLTPEQRVLRARLAANTRWSKENPREATKKATAAFMARFEDQVDPGRVLDDLERERRARSALRAHMLKLALKSSRARSVRGDAA